MCYSVEFFILIAEEHLTSTQKLSSFEQHLDYMLIIVIFSCFLWVLVEVEYVHG